MGLISILVGGLIGSLIEHFVSPVWPLPEHSYFQLGTAPEPWTLNGDVLGFGVGIWLDFTLMGIVGLLAGVQWFKRRKV